MTAEPQNNTAQSDEDWEREQEEAEQAMLNERVGLVVGGRYKIVRTLGAGGMGGVYEAEHELIGKKVALKCLHKEYTRDRDLVERFKREARAATAIGNEHIVDVTDMGDMADGAPFLVMEFLAGTTLSGLMEDEGAMRIPRAIHIARQVCDALGAAHDKGIVHRDLKPENVFLTRRGTDPDFVKVLDFGISKIHSGSAERPDRGLTRTGMAIGTPTYMSPEQAQGLRDVDARTDVWAMGVILYEMLTGHRPFEAESYPMLLMRIVGSEPDAVTKWRKDVPPALSAIVMRCLEKPVATRMQTMHELGAALAPFAALDSQPQVVDAQGRPLSSADGLRASTAVLGGAKRDNSDASIAATQMVPSSRPPANAASGVRASHVGNATRVVGGDETPATAGPRPAAKSIEQTGEIGSVPRKVSQERVSQERVSQERVSQERTGVIGSVLREDAESVTLPAARSNGPVIAIGAAVVLIAAVGLGWVISGTRPAETAVPPPPTLAPPTSVAVAPPTSIVAPPPTAVAVPAEVRVRISVVPNDATITIDGVEFPNPMDAMQPRRLTPIRIGVERDGYRSLDRLAIFDSDQNFHFELARGRGVQRVGVSGDELPEATHGGTAPPPSSGSGHTGSFRDQF